VLYWPVCDIKCLTCLVAGGLHITVHPLSPDASQWLLFIVGWFNVKAKSSSSSSCAMLFSLVQVSECSQSYAAPTV